MVFLDLVAHLIRKVLGLLSEEENFMLEDDFKFVLFVSFKNREEGIALELLEMFSLLCKKMHLDVFELYERFSDTNKERWNLPFIEKLIYAREVNEIKKIWVCGPPQLNEDFDKNLAVIGKKLNFASNVVDIL